MKKSYLIGLVGALALTALFLTTPGTRAQSNNCQHVEGHIDGQVLGPSSLCNSGLIEIGTFTDSDGNTLGEFVACVTAFEQEGEGALKLQLTHTYTPYAGGEFTTADNVVLSPTDPTLYRVNNRAIVTGGSGVYQHAFGFIEDHGTFTFLSAVTGVLSVDYHGQICTP